MLLALAAVLLMLVLRYTVTAYLDTHYQRHTIVIVLLLFLVALTLPTLFARSLRGAWRSRHERGTLFMTAGVIFVLWVITPTFPTEEALRSRFLDRRAAFEQLVTMIRADDHGGGNSNPFSSMTFAGAARSGRLPPQRLALYQHLLQQIGRKPFVFIDRLDGNISIFFRTTGRHESMKGYEYEFTATPPMPLVPSLDAPSQQGETRYKALSGRWYVFDYNGGNFSLWPKESQ